MSASPRSVVAPLAVVGTLLALMWLERRRPLRRRVEPQTARVPRNALLGALALATVAGVEAPLVRRVHEAVEPHRIGLLSRLPIPPQAQRVGALLLLDYTLYWWHVLLHRMPALWRAHRVHHADLDLDASTALRFHFVEMLWSAPFRALQVALIGVPRGTLALWGRLTLIEVMFHHSNLRLPQRLERVLGRLVATPRLHGIHHSVRDDERDRNFSSGLTVWDRLHGTFRDDVRQSAITIGLPECRRPEQVRTRWALFSPLRARRD